jgi:cytosine/adenosine deaminase-related metal-dependent hydrolase
LGAPIHQSPQTQGREPVGATGVAIADTSAAARPSVPAREAYRLASQSYDAESNPMLVLEQRFVERLLPSVAGLDVIDLGCGTGRWLAALARLTPRSLLGVDLSAEMLAQAKRKLGGAARLVLADCESLPLPRSSADLILCSFVTSYLCDLTVFAEQVRRLLRPGGMVFITDVHPTTSASLGWRRGFHVDGEFIDVATHSRPIHEMALAFEKFGMQTDAVLEPEFGDPELELFKRAGKTEAFRAAAGHPAVLILQLGLKRGRTTKARQQTGAAELKYLAGARVAFGANESTRAEVVIDGGRIGFLGVRLDSIANRIGQGRRSLDLSGYLLLPGLINAHDHLEFALFPRLGRGGYRNFLEWADDIHHPDAPPVREHRAVPKGTRLWWGGIRNILAGVTTVCHHNPYVAEVFDRGFIVRVLRSFSWAHSLQMDQEASAGRTHSQSDQPFIIHLAEGVDPQSAEEISHFSRKHALDDRTVIVHGLGLDERGFGLLSSAGAALVWCPTSNVFLFGRTHDRRRIQSLLKVALGSDSPLTARGDLLDEIRFAHETTEVPADVAYGLVTTGSAATLRLRGAEGTVRIGGVADFLAVRDTGLSPAQTLVSLSCHDVELVVIGGRVHLASPAIFARLPRIVTMGLQRLEVDGDIRWIRAPLDRLFSETRAHLAGDIRLGGKEVRYGLSS